MRRSFGSCRTVIVVAGAVALKSKVSALVEHFDVIHKSYKREV